MDVMKIGKYTVTGKMAEGVTEKERENSLLLLRDALFEQIKIDRERKMRKESCER